MTEINIQDDLDDSLRKVVKTSMFVFVGIVLSKILTYIYRVIIARKFGPEVFGLFSLALVILGWFNTIASFGLDGGLSRYIPFYRGRGEKDKIRFIFKYLIIVYLISGTIFGILLFLFSETISLKIFHNSQLIPFLRIFSIIIPISILTQPFIGTLKAYEKIGWHSFIFNISQNVVKIVILVFLIILGIKSNSVAWSYLMGTLSMVLLAYIVLKKNVKELFDKINLKSAEKKKLSKKLWGFSLPLMFFSIIGSLFYWVDTLMLGYYKGATYVGHYSVAMSLAFLLLMTSELLTPLFFPMVMKAYSQRKMAIIKNLSKQLTKWIFLINLPLFLSIFLFPGAFINILFGSAFSKANNALRILSIGTLFSSVIVISNQLMYASGKSKLILSNIVISTITNIVLNIILIPIPKILFIENPYGLEGAAIATTISVILLNMLFLIQSKKHFLFIPLKRKMITIALISIIPTLVLIYLRSVISMTLVSLILILSLFILIYCALIIVSGSLDKNDWMIIRAVWKKAFRVRDNTKIYQESATQDFI